MEDAQIRGKQWLEEVLQLAGFSSRVEAEYRSEALTLADQPPSLEDVGNANSCWLTIAEETLSPEQIQLLTGPNGTVLDAIQYLSNTILNLGQSQPEQQAFTIDLNQYRVRRQSELKAMAEQAAEQVRQTGHEYELKSLSSAERRQVHTFLQLYPDLETYSRGREPDRRLVVRRTSSSPESER
ncbi:MAG: R3H domain-containing nucleic acid-binding protein [Leptolyngbyaceae cyanobacterium bins.59]|nr:R3H domain-containing nucleic acid-binding protein [Leptolyngbyaceae cyanobacterium bins.59]